MEAYAGVFMIVNLKRAVVLYCYTSYAGRTKVFQQCWRKARKVYFLGCHANVSVFSLEIKELLQISRSKNIKIRDRISD